MDKVKLAKAMALNNTLVGRSDEGNPELVARMRAIESIIDAKLCGSNKSGSAHAMRNLAEHSFQIQFSELTSDQAPALQS